MSIVFYFVILPPINNKEDKFVLIATSWGIPQKMLKQFFFTMASPAKS
ncbi:hypothetical protein HMPREF9073_01441 [Capnocytophaga sp. oral taxon 326 str. F0382]|nr:hypothetical protein HMPREF9073_01441 [Capnocytophaga sp. oral taxon 326 str. F0382]